MLENNAMDEGLINMISMNDVMQFLDRKKRDAILIANAVSMCIISPCVLIFLAGLSDSGSIFIDESFALASGLVFLLGMIAIAVYLFILCGIQSKNVKCFEKDEFEVETVVLEMIKEKNTSFIPKLAKKVALGVVLCIIAVVPLLLAEIMKASDVVCCTCVSILLLLVAIGVNMILRVSIEKTSYDILLQEGEYSKEEKRAKKKLETLSSIYWCLITIGYLGWSFWTMKWEITWIIWPISSILYAAMIEVMKLNMIHSSN